MEDKVTPFTSWVRHHGGNSQVGSGQWNEYAALSVRECMRSEAADSAKGVTRTYASRSCAAAAQGLLVPAVWIWIGSDHDAR